MEWIQSHYIELFAIWGALLTLARLIVALTPTPNDDAAVEKYVGTPMKAFAKLFGLDLKQGLSSSSRSKPLKQLSVVLLLLCLSGCGPSYEQVEPRVWVLGGTDVDSPTEQLYGRGGLGFEDAWIEGGIEAMWRGVKGEGFGIGPYAIGYLEPTPVGLPYAGFHAGIMEGGEGNYYGPMTGTVNEIGGVLTVVEYQYRRFSGDLETIMGGDNEEHAVFGGLMFRF